jgi:hypothetical protein
LKTPVEEKLIQGEFCAAVTQAGIQGERIARINWTSLFQRYGKVENLIRAGSLEKDKPIPFPVKP